MLWFSSFASTRHIICAKSLWNFTKLCRTLVAFHSCWTVDKTFIYFAWETYDLLGAGAACWNVLLSNDDQEKKTTHPDTQEECDETDWDAEEEKEHEEPGAPVQPVAEAHHPHVLLQARREEGAWNQKKSLFPSRRDRANAPWASSPSPGPPPALCWGTCRWSWAPARGAAGSGWLGWRRRTCRPGRGSATAPPWSSTARWPPPSCWASAWSLGPRRAARPGSPLDSSLQRADSN